MVPNELVAGGNTKSAEVQAAEERPAEELRLALAMSGGVSLAIWIGGACAEIDELRQARVGGSDFWSKVLSVSGHERVRVDVLAGASAGGLNAVLYAASQLGGFTFAGLRDVWVETASTTSMRNEEHRAKPAGLSLFDGDGYFYPTLYAKLEALAADAAEAAKNGPTDRPAIELRMAATLVEPITRPVPGPPGEGSIMQRRFSSGFSFRKSHYRFDDDNLTVRPDDDVGARRDVLARLALAGRATSSFPVAFEAARVVSPRPATFAPPEPPRPAVQAPDERNPGTPMMHGTFVDSRDGADPFVLSDGGITNNLPIDKALQAIAEAPADTSTRRELLFLEPSAATPPDAPGDGTADPPPTGSMDRRRSTFEVVTGFLGYHFAEETIAEDIAAIEEYNRAIGRADARRAATFAAIQNRAELEGSAVAAFNAYKIERCSHDAGLICQLLDDPIGFLGHDPFPTTPPDLSWRSPLRRWSPDQRVELEWWLGVGVSETLGETVDEARHLRAGVLPLIRLSQLLIEWARHVERFARDEAGRDAASGVKAKLYRLLRFVRVALDEPRRLGWVLAAAQAKPGVVPKPPGGLSDTPHAHDVTAALLNITADAELERAVKRARTGLDSPVEAYADDLRDAVVAALVALAQELNTIGCLEVPEPTTGGELLHRALRADGQEITKAVLAHLEVVCFAEFTTGIPGRRRASLHRLSAGNRMPLAPKFGALFKAAEERDQWWDPDQTNRDDLRGIHVDLKLAGNELAHFSAFLIASWRRNDWLWGRLDAVPTLVDLLLTDDALRRALGPANRVEAAHALVAQGSAHDDLLEHEVWLPNKPQITEEVGGFASFPTLRNAVIARRQWEIIAAAKAADPSEWAATCEVDPADPPNEALSDPSKALVASVWCYGVGAEQIKGNHSLEDEFDELADGVTDTAVTNVDLALAKPLPNAGRGAVRKLVSVISHLVARSFTKGLPKARLLGLLAVIASVVLLVGWVTVATTSVSPWLGLFTPLIALVLIGIVLFSYLWWIGRPESFDG